MKKIKDIIRMKDAFYFLIEKKPDQKVIKLYCLTNDITVEEFYDMVYLYVEKYTTTVELKKYKQYQATYLCEQIVNQMFNAKSNEECIKILNDNFENYGLIRQSYLEKYPYKDKMFKKFDIMYRGLVDEHNSQRMKEYNQNKSKPTKAQQQYIRLINRHFEKMDEMIKQNNLYIDEEVNHIRFYLERLQNHSNYNKKLKRQYKDDLKKYYQIIFDKVYDIYKQNGKQFTSLDYYYITDLSPLHLRRNIPAPTIDDDESRERWDAMVDIFSQTAGNYTAGNYNGFAPRKIFENGVDMKLQYIYQGKTLSYDELSKIYNFMIQENLPKIEPVFNSLVKKYIETGILESRRQAQENMKKLVKRVP